MRSPWRHGWATVEGPPVVEPLRLQGPRRGPQPGRAATLALRLCPLPRRPPQQRKAERLPAVALWAVQVREGEPPAGGEPGAWLWLSTVAVQTVADAIARVAWYACGGGPRRLAQNFAKGLSDRSPAVGHRGAPAALLAPLQRPCLAGVVCHHVGAGGAGDAVPRAVGERGMAGALLGPPSLAAAA